jgi:hypothetical protein
MARREAAREREASPDLVKLPGGGDILGGDDSLEAAKARFLLCPSPAPRHSFSCTACQRVSFDDSADLLGPAVLGLQVM